MSGEDDEVSEAESWAQTHWVITSHTHTRAQRCFYSQKGSCKRPETASGCKGFVKHITATQLQCFLNLHGDNTLNAAQEWPTALGSVWFRGGSSMSKNRLQTSNPVRLYSDASRALWAPRTMQWNKEAAKKHGAEVLHRAHGELNLWIDACFIPIAPSR